MNVLMAPLAVISDVSLGGRPGVRTTRTTRRSTHNAPSKHMKVSLFGTRLGLLGDLMTPDHPLGSIDAGSSTPRTSPPPPRTAVIDTHPPPRPPQRPTTSLLLRRCRRCRRGPAARKCGLERDGDLELRFVAGHRGHGERRVADRLRGRRRRSPDRRHPAARPRGVRPVRGTPPRPGSVRPDAGPPAHGQGRRSVTRPAPSLLRGWTGGHPARPGKAARRKAGLRGRGPAAGRGRQCRGSAGGVARGISAAPPTVPVPHRARDRAPAGPPPGSAAARRGRRNAAISYGLRPTTAAAPGGAYIRARTCAPVRNVTKSCGSVTPRAARPPATPLCFVTCSGTRPPTPHGRVPGRHPGGRAVAARGDELFEARTVFPATVRHRPQAPTVPRTRRIPWWKTVRRSRDCP
jgi:hypothetical protein